MTLAVSMLNTGTPSLVSSRFALALNSHFSARTKLTFLSPLQAATDAKSVFAT
jgi:hypothetical protein